MPDNKRTMSGSTDDIMKLMSEQRVDAVFPGLPDPKFAVGDEIWTYARRFGDTPQPTKGEIMSIIAFPGYFPPVQYVVKHNGIICFRDEYTIGLKIEDVLVVSLGESMNIKDFTYDD